jgi:excisionase family DNA binding protein
MSDILDQRPEPAVPSTKDTELAREASRTLARRLGEELKVNLDDGTVLVLPKAATRLLSYLLTEMSQGNAVTIIPLHAELTTQEAADILNVSRPHLIKLLEAVKIPYHMAGTHRRIKFSDLRAYEEQSEAQRKAAMEELARQAQELRLGY